MLLVCAAHFLSDRSSRLNREPKGKRSPLIQHETCCHGYPQLTSDYSRRLSSDWLRGMSVCECNTWGSKGASLRCTTACFIWLQAYALFLNPGLFFSESNNNLTIQMLGYNPTPLRASFLEAFPPSGNLLWESLGCLCVTVRL